ncbi:MAG TPA: DoxX subfamily [Blastocatellia bacterium]|nr:DoxX subfamily [Blastocatellia bacterium]
MNSKAHHYLSGAQQTALLILRTLIGWHFLYEGYYKLMLPAWSSDGKPLPPWTSVGYLKSASGPLARVFQWLIDAGWIGWIDMTVKISLLSIGLSLILGLLTRVGGYGALFFLALFYLLAIPTAGMPQPGNEGTYLLVNKTLIEAAAVGVLLVFNTGAIAGLDMFLTRWKDARRIHVREATVDPNPAFDAGKEAQ